MNQKEFLSIKSIVAIGIGAALFFVLGRFVSIPSPIPSTTINIQYAILGVLGVIYGPVVGALTGFIGHTLVDLSLGTPWWSWIIASAVYGLIVGFSMKQVNITEGSFGLKEILFFNGFQAVGHITAWVLVAPVLDILIHTEPPSKVFAQGAFASIVNLLSTAILGTILLGAYAKTQTKTGSLMKED